MARTALLALLLLALVVELALTFGAFFAPAFTLGKFGVPLNDDTAFLGYIVAWLLLFVSLAAGLALVWVRQRHPGYPALCYLLGVWWMGIGVGIYLAFGKPGNLLLDTLKGLLLVLATWQSRRSAVPARA